jgi:hypothetical protein
MSSAGFYSSASPSGLLLEEAFSKCFAAGGKKGGSLVV